MPKSRSNSRLQSNPQSGVKGSTSKAVKRRHRTKLSSSGKVSKASDGEEASRGVSNSNSNSNGVADCAESTGCEKAMGLSTNSSAAGSKVTATPTSTSTSIPTSTTSTPPTTMATMAPPEIPTATSLPRNWPADITYLATSKPHHSLPPSTLSSLYTSSFPSSPSSSLSPPQIYIPSTHPAIQSPSPLTLITPLTSFPHHPASPQYGLFANKDLPPSTLILTYNGIIHDSSTTDPDSDYDISLDREADLAVDARFAGNEARFVNDYRGVPYINLKDHDFDFGFDFDFDTTGNTDAGGRRTLHGENEASGTARRKDKTKRMPSPNHTSSPHRPQKAVQVLKKPNAEFRDVFVELATNASDSTPNSSTGNNESDHLPLTLSTISQSQSQSQSHSYSHPHPHSHPHSQSHPQSQPHPHPHPHSNSNSKPKTYQKRLAIFTLTAGKKPATPRSHGIKAGQEILVSYGKGFWSQRKRENPSESEPCGR